LDLPVTGVGAQPPPDSLAAQPRALIVTVYGLYGREAGGWLSIAGLIRLMAGLGVDEPAVRSAISRLKQRGLLESRRAAGAAGYGLTGRGQAILAEGDMRIFERPRARIEDGWLIAVFSVPEDQRARRHALRSRLAWLGFGSVAAGVWIAPAHLATETRSVLAGDGLDGYVTLFTAGQLAFGEIGQEVSRWWDLDRLGQLYQAFIDAADPVLARWQAGPGTARAAGPGTARAAGQGTARAAGRGAGREAGRGAGREAGRGAGREAGRRAARGDSGHAFADYVRVLTAWRRLPFLDPGLPPDLLPADWRGATAAELFGQIRARLAGPAAEYAREICG
jgi:phenylacetic acid degradation operon negative regulatory protein